MSDEIIHRVLNLGSKDLDPIVQAVLGDQSATVTGSLDCQPTGGQSVGVGTLAILKLAGEADTSSGPAEWSVVIKAMEVGESIVARHNDPRVEIDAYDSGLLTKIGTGMRSVRCYRVDRLPDDQVWLWIEDVSGWIGPPWDSAGYAIASECVGQFSGHWSIKDFPSAQFFAANPITRRFTWPPIATSFMGLDEGVAPEPVLRKILPEDSFHAAVKLGRSVGLARSVVEAGPRTLVHGDCHPRNLFISPDGGHHKPKEIVAFDWATIGTDHIGADFGTLIGSGMTWHEDEFRMIIESEQLYFQAFLDGLAGGGWKGDRDVVRLGHLYVVCGYGMMLAGKAGAIGNNSPWRNNVMARIGEHTPESASASYARRLVLMEPFADELASLVG